MATLEKIYSRKSFALVLCCMAMMIGAYGQSQIVDVQTYDFTIHLSADHDTILGQALITVKAIKSSDGFWLDLESQKMDGIGMRVQSVFRQEKPILFEHQGDSLRISDTLNSGQLFSYTINYRGIPGLGLIIGENRHGDRTFFGDNWPNRAHYWLPCIDHPLDKAKVIFRIYAPEYFDVVATGVLIEETNLGNGNKRSVWQSPHLLPTKSMVIGVARFAVAHETFDKTPVSRWIFHQDRQTGFSNYDWTTPILTYFQEKMGAYPFGKLAHVQSKTRWGGSENAGTIFYSEKSVDPERNNEALFAHEIAHQWFGNSASEADWLHVWLSEGFATYFAHLYFEDRYGIQARQQRMLNDRMRIIKYYHERPEPVIQKQVEDLDQILSVNSYQKGSWFLHMLRQKVGDQIFWKGINKYYHTYAYGNALTEDLQSIFEEVSGHSLSLFFEQWLKQTGHPRLSMSWNYYNGKVILQIKQHQREKFIFSMPIEIRMPNSLIQKHQILMDSPNVTISIPVDIQPDSVLYDPNVELLFEVVTE